MDNSSSNKSTSLEQLLNSIVDSAFFGIMAFKSVRDVNDEIIDFEWIFANKTASEIVGHSVSGLIGARLLQLLPGNRETGLFDIYKNVVETGNFISTEQYYRADNLDSWFQITASRLDDGFAVTFQDISAFKKAQAEVETKGKKYQKLFDESIDAIYLLDDQLNFLTVNSSFLQLFGFKLQGIIGSPISKMFLNRDDYEPFQEALKTQHRIDELEVFLLTNQDSKKFCLINSVSIYDEEKQRLNYLGVIRDMTKRKQAERDIIRAEKLAMTGKIARTIAHEIRNPLTNLSLALDQLKEEIPSEVEDAELYLGIIERNSKRIEKLITDLLNSTKPKELKLTRQSVKALVSETLVLVKDRLHLQEMKLAEDFTEEDFSLPLDKDQFKIALLNLLINAIEAMEPKLGVLKVSIVKAEDHLELIIEDNGKGISPEDIKQLFEPFFTGKSDGAGLGLTTVQNIVHSHHGKIEVESEPGKGTAFIVRFPLVHVE